MNPQKIEKSPYLGKNSEGILIETICPSTETEKQKILSELYSFGVNLEKSPPIPLSTCVQEFSSILDRQSKREPKRKRAMGILREWNEDMYLHEKAIKFLRERGVHPDCQVYRIVQIKYELLRSLYSEAIAMMNGISGVMHAANKMRAYHETRRNELTDYYNPHRMVMEKPTPAEEAQIIETADISEKSFMHKVGDKTLDLLGDFRSFESFGRKLAASVFLTTAIWTAARTEIIEKFSQVFENMGNFIYVAAIGTFMASWYLVKGIIRRWGWKKTFKAEDKFLKACKEIEKWLEKKIDNKIAMFKVNYIKKLVDFADENLNNYWDELKNVFVEGLDPDEVICALNEKKKDPLYRYIEKSRRTLLDKEKREESNFRKPVEITPLARSCLDKSKEIDGLVTVNSEADYQLSE
ncbi:hypothetical protein KO465_01025 [Candidatus Micrarchaeota archaeon]|nr:hypothetical protein [Candidatus Micrarchaeota archaeon]